MAFFPDSSSSSAFSHGMRNEMHFQLKEHHRLVQCSRFLLARDQKYLCLLEAGESGRMFSSQIPDELKLVAHPVGLGTKTPFGRDAPHVGNGVEAPVFQTEVRHEIRLPEEKVIIPGVLDSTTNFIEHPELVAQRIERYASVIGREHVIAGTDCGFATFSGALTVDPDITWAKLAAMVEGAQIASDRLWESS
jgi:hypothetical protein